MLFFRARDPALLVHRPRITPDPSQVEALERRFRALSYQPRNGFHRDLRQDRTTPAAARVRSNQFFAFENRRRTMARC